MKGVTGGGPVQVKKCADAGADIVRITVQGRQEAAACMKIREQLFKDRCAAWPHETGCCQSTSKASSSVLPSLKLPVQPLEQQCL